MCAQPLDKMKHILVAPHPDGEAFETCERFAARDIVVHAAHIAIDAVGIGPVSLDSDRCKAFLGNQSLRNLCSRLVELVRAVGGLTKQDKVGITDHVQQGIVILLGAGERMGGHAYGISEITRMSICHSASPFSFSCPSHSVKSFGGVSSLTSTHVSVSGLTGGCVPLGAAAVYCA